METISEQLLSLLVGVKHLEMSREEIKLLSHITDLYDQIETLESLGPHKEFKESKEYTECQTAINRCKTHIVKKRLFNNQDLYNYLSSGT